MPHDQQLQGAGLIGCSCALPRGSEGVARRGFRALSNGNDQAKPVIRARDDLKSNIHLPSINTDDIFGTHSMCAGHPRRLGAPPSQLSRKLLRILDRLGCLSFLSALASICRMRSRVTENWWPTSSSV